MGKGGLKGIHSEGRPNQTVVSMQSDQSLHCPLTESLDMVKYIGVN